MCVHTSGMLTLVLACAVCPAINPAEDIDFLFTGSHKWIHKSVSLSASKTLYLSGCNPECIIAKMIGCAGTSRVQLT